jgi:hypothetical protein
MEMTRRTTLVVSLVAALACFALPGCYKQVPAVQKSVQATIVDPPYRAGSKTIAILMPLRTHTVETRNALVDDLSSSFNVVTIRTEAGVSVEQIGRDLVAAQPACIVVMDNRTMRLYRELQRAAPERTFPPAVILMTSFLDQAIGTLRDATGIAYEVPAVTSFVAARELAKKPIHRVGVIYRRAFAGMVARQARLAAVEKLTIVGAEVAEQPGLNAIDDALYDLIHERRVDALWVLNDNNLLARDALAEVWLPRLRDTPVPVVVGVSTLVRPEAGFGTLAVLPDHEGLGSQAANMIFALSDNDWKIGDLRVDLPISVRTVANVGQLRHDFGIKPGALDKMDEALE